MSLNVPDQVSRRSDNAHGVEIRLFEGITNAAEVRTFVDTQCTATKWVCAVDLAAVASPVQLIVAAVKTAQRMASDAPFKTGSARGDLYFHASHHCGVAEAIRLMQVSSTSQDIAIVTIQGSEEFTDRMYQLVQGRPVSDMFEWFSGQNNGEERLVELAKLYKLTPQEMKVSSIEQSILTKIAVKEYIK